ncbi:LysR family transcriptional regulator [Hydrogeniiclostridium mannosilyticum]|uniref:LysR family transcriptional regulator n=1 Tax=Hydrogeniiclostridium mannosilyticum TaxID=2764322 RepID=UPI00399962F9
MTLRHLVIFKAVFEELHFTRAAERLYLTQSAVSHAIKDLEEETGTVLFERRGREMAPTSYAVRFWEQASGIVEQYEHLNRTIKHLQEETPLRIASCITMACYWLPGVLCAFTQRLPQIPVNVTVASATQVTELLRTGKTDLALLEGARPNGSFGFETFSAYTLKVACAPDYCFQAGQPGTPEELAVERLLLRERGSAIRDTLDSFFLLNGITLQPLWTSVNSTALVQAAKAGLGITVLPDVLIQGEVCRGTLKLLPVTGFSLQNEIFAAWNEPKHFTEPLQTFLDCIRDGPPSEEGAEAAL